MVVQAVVTLLLALSLGLTIGGASARDLAQQQYAGIGGVQIGFVTVAGVVCIAIMVRVVVRMTRTSIAQWQLAGMSPGAAARTVFSMTLLTSLVGCAAGAALAYVAWRPFGDFVVSADLPVIGAFTRPLGSAAAISAWASGVVTSALAGVLNLRSTSKVEAVEAVRQDSMTSVSFSGVRWVSMLLLTGGLLTALWGISQVAASSSSDQLSGVLAGYWGTELLCVVIVVVGGGPLVVLVTRLWTALVPARWALPWFLARSSAIRRGEYAAAIVLPLFVAGGSMGSVYGLTRQTVDAAAVLGAGTVSVSPLRQLILVFGGPVAVALATTIAAVVAMSRKSLQDNALLAVAGTGRWTLLCSTVLEYVIHCATALGLCYGVLGLNGYLAVEAMNRGPVPGAHDVGTGPSSLVVITGGFAAALVVVLLPLLGPRLSSPITMSRGNRR